MTKFKVGELIKRKALSTKHAKALCVVVDNSGDNYTIYNNSLKCLQVVALGVIEGLYDSHEVEQC